MKLEKVEWSGRCDPDDLGGLVVDSLDETELPRRSLHSSRCLALFLALLLTEAPCYGYGIDLQWTVSITGTGDPPVIGYLVYFGQTSRGYGASVPAPTTVALDGNVHFRLNGVIGPVCVAVSGYNIYRPGNWSNEKCWDELGGNRTDGDLFSRPQSYVVPLATPTITPTPTPTTVLPAYTIG